MSNSTHPVGLVRLSRQGKAIWEAHHSNCHIIGNLVVSTTVLYYVFELPSMHKHVFVGRSIKDGTIVLQEDVPFAPSDYKACRLHLFGNAKWAAFEDLYASNIFIIDTTTGKVVSSFSNAWDGRRSFSPTEARIWEFRYHGVKKSWLVSESTYDSNVKALIRKDLCVSFSTTPRSFVWGIDGYRQLCFRAEYDLQLPVARLAVGLLTAQTAQAYRQLDGTRHSTVTESSLPTVTIPARSKRKGSTRRDLNVPYRYRMPSRWAGFCGMVGDYLLIHAAREKELFLVDFWPTW